MVSDSNPFAPIAHLVQSFLANRDESFVNAASVFQRCSRELGRHNEKQRVALHAPRHHPVFASVSHHLHTWLQQHTRSSSRGTVHQRELCTLAADDGAPSSGGSGVAEERVLISEVHT